MMCPRAEELNFTLDGEMIKPNFTNFLCSGGQGMYSPVLNMRRETNNRRVGKVPQYLINVGGLINIGGFFGTEFYVPLFAVL